MATNSRIKNSIVSIVGPKAKLRKDVETSVSGAFENLCYLLGSLVVEYKTLMPDGVDLKFDRPAQHVAVFTIDADVLVFNVQTDIFQFNRDHKVYNLDYVKQDANRSYVGMINVYNLMSDTVKYERIEDAGFLIARLFVNSEGALLVEGKQQQRSMGVSHYGEQKVSTDNLRRFAESAIKYAVSSDALVPPYEDVMIINYAMVKESIMKSKPKTSKRLGFGFRADDVE